jgi:hypothetical protein
MLTISENDYRELRRITQLRKAGKISEARFRKLTSEILDPLRRREELRNKKKALRDELHKKLREIDSAYSKRGGITVQGGLPSLGKRR